MQRLTKRISGISPSLTLAISAKAKAMKAAGEDVVNFGVGEPDFATPAHIVAAAKQAIDEGHTKYTASSGIPELKKAICDKLLRDNGLTYEPSQIIVSNGAKHSLFNACSALVEEGDEVIIPSPYWLSYPELVKLCGGTPVFVKAERGNGFKITPEQLKAAITPKTKMFIFNSPSNPTGAVYTESEVRAIGKVCEEAGIFVLADEIYEKLVYTGVKPFSIANCSEKLKENTIVVNGVSKTYAMTGWRIGYLAAPKDIAKAIDSFQSHATSNANTIAQYAALKAIESSEEEIIKMRNVFAARREKMLERIKTMHEVFCVVPDGAFYVMIVVEGLYGRTYRGKKIENSVDFATSLLETEKVATVPGKAFGADDCVRLSYSLSMEDMLKGLDRIEKFIEELE